MYELKQGQKVDDSLIDSFKKYHYDTYRRIFIIFERCFVQQHNYWSSTSRELRKGNEGIENNHHSIFFVRNNIDFKGKIIAYFSCD